MSKRTIRLIVVAAALALAVAGAAYAADKPTVIRLGNLILTIDGGITPTKLPKHRMAPLGFHASGELATVDGSHPPAWKESSFDVDKDVEVDVSGIPACRKGQLLAQNSTHAKQACPGSILGQGRGSVEVAFPEQRPFEATGPVLLFNGGERNGVTTFFLHTYVAIPAPTAIVVTAKLTRERKGPYGIHIQTAIPLIAGGSGSITQFELGASRFVTYRGKRHSFLFARCSDGSLVAGGAIEFRDGTIMSGQILRACTPTS
jgi:hypothetical protein